MTGKSLRASIFCSQQLTFTRILLPLCLLFFVLCFLFFVCCCLFVRLLFFCYFLCCIFCLLFVGCCLFVCLLFVFCFLVFLFCFLFFVFQGAMIGNRSSWFSRSYQVVDEREQGQRQKARDDRLQSSVPSS